jgi:hypothetical protein
MDARFLDMFHNARDEEIGAVTEAIDIELDRILQVGVEQHGAIAEQMPSTRAATASGLTGR